MEIDLNFLSIVRFCVVSVLKRMELIENFVR